MSSCDFLAGCVSGLIIAVLGHPLETIKVRMHIYGDRGITATSRNVRDLQGYRGFYRGLTVSLVHSSLNTGGAYILYSKLRQELKQDSGHLGCCEHQDAFPFLHTKLFVCGVVSGLSNVPLSCPIEIVKTRQQTHGINLNHSLPRSIGNIYNAKGRTTLRNFYHGFAPLCFRDGLSVGCFVVIQEHLECSIRQKFSLECGSNWVTGISGGIAGVSYLVFGYPFDVVKTRMMTDRLDRPIYQGTVHCLKLSWQHHGLWKFYTGGLPATIRAFIVSGAGLVTFRNMLDTCVNS